MSALKMKDLKQKRFELPVILEAVSKVEKGLSRKRICEEYGVALVTLGDWLKRHGSAHYHANKRHDLPREQRRSIVQAVLQQRITIRDASQQYRIKEKTIHSWIRTFI